MINKLTKILKVFLSYIALLSLRSRKKVIFGAWFGNKFADNSKYLYKAMLNYSDIRPIWITQNKDVYENMKKNRYEVYLNNSIKGIYHQLTASAYFTCTGKADVSYYLLSNARHIELWHGIPLKKIMYDDKISNDHNRENDKKIIKRIMNWPGKKKRYVVSTSDKISEIYTSAFNLDKSKIIQLGQPRNDVFFSEEIEDIGFPKEYKEKKVILYMPTHRNEGKTKIEIEKILDLERINNICKANGWIFLVKKHYYHKDEITEFDKYSNIKDITKEIYDSQMLLKYTDILITDYSSCYIDYLLLDRPVIFYNYDYENYIMKDREMYFEYDSVTPGKKAENYLELEKELIELIQENNDEYRELRKEVRDLFYSRDNQNKVSEKIIEHFILKK
ncbi:MAG: CDP-glycerol--poly(glycerophosphate) glycerophosphotransferase [Clostridiales bacterium]|nr:CDP-glycerol--poly(glycerophosphate) glycerophosphotransferase [Clostridiales bacterium]